MPNRSLPNRRTVRLQEYDYAQEGAYFVTVCTARRAPIFGTIVEEDVHLTPIGKVVETEWVKTPSIRSNVYLDEFVVMPDHVHGIIILLENRGYGQVRGFRSPSETLGAIIRGWKGAVTKHARRICKNPHLDIWQRGYWEHIIRNDADLDEIRYYIKYNAMKDALRNESLRKEMTFRS